MIHQHLTLVDRFTGAENIALATGGGVGTGVIAAAAAGRALARDLGFSVDLDRRVEEMPPACASGSRS
ncbi:hypothetical protein ACFQ4K_23435 [Tistrella bauzanensis]